jgi:hypothetical protein
MYSSSCYLSILLQLHSLVYILVAFSVGLWMANEKIMERKAVAYFKVPSQYCPI